LFSIRQNVPGEEDIKRKVFALYNFELADRDPRRVPPLREAPDGFS